MGYAIGQITGVGGDAHKQLLGVIKTLAEGNGWVTVRYDNTSPDHELILQGEGLTGTEEIYIGFKTYEDQAADYYNIACAGFTGYVANVEFESQPGAQISGTFSHNNAIAYVIMANPQRITGWQKVGTPVYSHFYLGKMLPYARPSEYPYPLVTGGMLNGKAATRYSSSAATFPYAGYRYSTSQNWLYVRGASGVWQRPTAHPWNNYTSMQYALAGSPACLAPIGANLDIYQVEPIILYMSAADLNRKEVFGELDGVYFCSGWNNGPENVLQIGGGSIVDQTGLSMADAIQAIHGVAGRAFVMGQDNTRTGWRNYVALEAIA